MHARPFIPTSWRPLSGCSSWPLRSFPPRPLAWGVWDISPFSLRCPRTFSLPSLCWPWARSRHGGSKELVSFAGVMTVVEIGGLLLLVVAGLASEPTVITRLPESIPATPNPTLFAGLISTTLLAVFAFIGFEGLANVAEEVRDPRRNLPRAIFTTLVISTLLYVAVVWISLVTIGERELATSDAPLALVFERLTGASPKTMSLIAVMATLNGIIVQIIMASRVLYGLAHQRDLPAILARVNAVTRTPLVATALTTAAVSDCWLLCVPLHDLAETTARLTLVVFTVVNISLIRIKRGSPSNVQVVLRRACLGAMGSRGRLSFRCSVLDAMMAG